MTRMEKKAQFEDIRVVDRLLEENLRRRNRKVGLIPYAKVTKNETYRDYGVWQGQSILIDSLDTK